MTLRANKPWIEIAAFGMLAFFTVKFLLLTVEKGEPGILIPTILFLTMSLAAPAWINREYRSYELGSKLSFRGRFWGQEDFELNELTGFKIKERMNTTNLVPFSEY